MKERADCREATFASLLGRDSMNATRPSPDDVEDRLLRTLQEIVAMLFIERATAGPGIREAAAGHRQLLVQAVGRKRLLH